MVIVHSYVNLPEGILQVSVLVMDFSDAPLVQISAELSMSCSWKINEHHRFLMGKLTVHGQTVTLW